MHKLLLGIIVSIFTFFSFSDKSDLEDTNSDIDGYCECNPCQNPREFVDNCYSCYCENDLPNNCCIDINDTQQNNLFENTKRIVGILNNTNKSLPMTQYKKSEVQFLLNDGTFFSENRIKELKKELGIDMNIPNEE